MTTPEQPKSNRLIKWLRQEIFDGPHRVPPMPEVQVEIHRRQLVNLIGEHTFRYVDLEAEIAEHQGEAQVIPFPVKPDPEYPEAA